MRKKKWIRIVVFVGPLWLTLSAFHPPDFFQELEKKYAAYTGKYTGVKLQLLFNQPYYAPGDTAFFQAWYLNESLQPLKGEHSVTLELFNTDKKPVQKMRFKVKDGKGFNQLVIRSDLASGGYTVVAYTDWMRNFDASWFCEKRMKIVGDKVIRASNTASTPVTFYPEGGKLVGGLSNNIVVTGPQNEPLSIKDQTGVLITTVSLDSSGLGIVEMTPLEGQSYYAVSPQQSKQWPLPKIDGDGIAIRLKNEESGAFQMTIPAGSRWVDQELYAVVLSQGEIIMGHRLVLRAGEPFNMVLSEGLHAAAVHQLYIFDGQGNVLTERVFFPSLKQSLTMKLNIPTQVMQRERVSASFELLDVAGNSQAADFTVTVYQRDLFDRGGMDNGFTFSDLPEVSAWIESGGELGLVNNFLVTQRWEKISWDRILSDKNPVIKYPFYSEPRFSGRVISTKDGSPAPDSTLVIGYLQHNTIGYEAYLKNGKFDIPMGYDYWGDDEIFCTVQYKSKSVDDMYDIVLTEDTLRVDAISPMSETTEPSRYGHYSRNKIIVANAYSFFGNRQEDRPVADGGPNSVFEDEFLGADYEVNVQDYLTFPTLVDLLQEAVPFVKYKKRGTEESIRMSYRYEKSLKVFKNDPLYIIDGLMTKSTAFFLGLKPEDLLFIKVLNNPNKLTQLGKLGENAVIFVESKKGDLYKSIPSDKLFTMVGLSRAKQFYETDHGQGSSDRIPDLRSTLYWKPNLGISNARRAEFNFFASDDIGPMKVIIRGLTKGGFPFQYETEFFVQFNSGK